MVPQLGQTLEQQIRSRRPNLLGGPQAVRHADAIKPSLSCHLDISGAVPDHGRQPRINSGEGQDLQSRLRMRLALNCTVPAQDDLEVALDLETCEDALAEGERLVGHDGLSLPAEMLEGLPDSGVEAGGARGGGGLKDSAKS